jgi:hypothetical protein
MNLLKKDKLTGTGGTAQAVEHLPTKHEVLNFKRSLTGEKAYTH